MRLPLRGAISAYEACAADAYRAFGGSWFIGSVLTMLYFMAFTWGLLLGALIYELLLGPFGRPLGSSINRALHVAALLLLLYAASSLMCIVARATVRGITYLCYEMRGDVLFYLLIVATVAAAALLIISAVLPPIVSDATLDAVAGLSVMGVLIFGTLTAWLYVRYRWPSNPRARVFDRDIGLAWSHMSDPRRARFRFGEH
jgi:hypothetical protein